MDTADEQRIGSYVSILQPSLIEIKFFTMFDSHTKTEMEIVLKKKSYVRLSSPCEVESSSRKVLNKFKTNKARGHTRS